MNCSIHEHAPAIGSCAACGRALCEACAIHWQGRTVCKSCLEGQPVARVHTPGLHKSPTLAGVLSIFPGLGQLYVGYYLAGFVILVVVALIITMLAGNHAHQREPFFGLFLSFFWLFNIIDAVRRAKVYNAHVSGGREEAPPTDSPLVGGIVLAIVGLILTLEVTLGVELEFLESVWPLGILALAVYLLVKYVKTRDALRRPAEDTTPGRGPLGGPRDE